ncbi:MAG: TlpA family protein disulfide reductase [Planctomycetes bacterium]|nr:TlpA family protein disulfide reductase [Planctomycetota bacterium]
MTHTFAILAAATALLAPCARAEMPADAYPGMVGTKAAALAGRAWLAPGEKPVELAGKVHLIDFWFRTCPPCIAAIPDLKKLHAEFAPRGLVLVGASTDDPETAREAVKELAIPYPVLAKVSDECVLDYSVERFPTLVLVGADGVILWRGEKWDGEARAALEKALPPAPVDASPAAEALPAKPPTQAKAESDSGGKKKDSGGASMDYVFWANLVLPLIVLAWLLLGGRRPRT